MDSLFVMYHLDATAGEVHALANSVLLEQTIETPVSVGLRYPFVRDEMMGEIVRLDADPAGGYLAEMALPIHTARVDAAQFMNVIWGNVSLHPNVTLRDVVLPETVRAQFTGPRFGIAGMRERIGVHGRPVTCSAIKPVGLSLDEVVGICRTFAEAGLDYIKDDHYLADHPFCPFEDRVRTCQDAVDEVAARTGHRAVYVPNLSGTPSTVFRQAEQAQARGVGAVMVSAMLLGLPTFHELVQQHLSVPVLAHPSFMGTPKIAMPVLAKLLRLYGADAVIFVNYGGRFSYPPADCRTFAETLRMPWHNFAPSLPTPAGGMTVERAPELVEFFGVDTMLLIGGSLLEAGDDLLARSRSFQDAVKAAAQQIAPTHG